MFRLQRQTVLNKSLWKPEERQLQYIEARIFENAKTLSPDTYWKGSLNDEDVEDWLRQTGRYAPAPNSHLGKEEGGIRLLLCERRSFMPLAFGLSKASLLAIEREFGLPGEMLPIFQFHGGGYSHQFVPPLAYNQRPEKLLMTIKVPQMFQVANYGLCMKYCFKTRTTLAFMYGWNVISDENWKVCMEREYPEYLEPHICRISGLIESQISNWKHPLLLPVTMLEDHVDKADRFKGRDLSIRVKNLEGDLLVTKTGRNANQETLLSFDIVNQRLANNRFEITRSINTAATDAVSFGCNLKWNSRYCQFLRDISKRLKEFPEVEQDAWGPGVDNDIELLATLVISIIEFTESLKARLDIQLNVLYNFVAQVDSHVNYNIAVTNSTIAATTRLDSVAMKALAIVTTIFLPPTYIATLFSMSMFDWQFASSSSSEKGGEQIVVSRYFGIYWAVSVPLTVAVLVSWRLWWRREKNHYQEKYPDVKMD